MKSLAHPSPKAAESMEARGGALLWWLTAITLPVDGGWLGWNTREDYRAMIEREYSLLEIGARNRAAHIGGLIRGIDVMLFTIERDVQEDPLMPVAEMNRMMKERIRQILELRSMSVMNREGRIVASSLDRLVGFDASKRPYFSATRDLDAGHGGKSIFISKPFQSTGGDWVVLFARARHDGQGQFNGITTCSLLLKKFGDLLAVGASLPGEESLAMHEGGEVIFAVPRTEQLAGKSLAGGGAFAEHAGSHLDTTRHRVVAEESGREVMTVFHHLPNTPLIVAASRPYAEAIAPWERSMLVRAGGFALWRPSC